MGPVLGLAAAGGAAYAATRKDKIGEAALSTGRATCPIGDKAVDIDRQHDISGKFKRAASDSYLAAKRLDQKHNVSGKAASAWTSGMNWMTEKLQKR